MKKQDNKTRLKQLAYQYGKRAWKNFDLIKSSHVISHDSWQEQIIMNIQLVGMRYYLKGIIFYLFLMGILGLISLFGVHLFEIFTFLPLYNNYPLPVLAGANFLSFLICFLIFIFQLFLDYRPAFFVWQSIRQNKRHKAHLIRRIFDTIFWNFFQRLYYIFGLILSIFGSYFVINQQWIDGVVDCDRLLDFCAFQFLLLIVGNYIAAICFFYYLFPLLALFGRASDLETYGNYD